MHRRLLVLGVMLTNLSGAAMASEYVIEQQLVSRRGVKWDFQEALAYLKSDNPAVPVVVELDFREADLVSHTQALEKLAKMPLPYLRQINLSGSWENHTKGVDAFLRIFSQNHTLRSLMSVDVSCSDVSLEALQQLRSLTLEPGQPFVRDMSSFSGRYNCNLVSIHVDLNGVKLDRDQLMLLSRPRAEPVTVEYRSDPDSADNQGFFSLLIR